MRSEFYKIIVFLVTLLFIPASSFPSADTESENTSIHAIRVVMDDNYPPYIFKEADGRLKGILVDQWNLWEKKTGISVQLSAMDWEEAQQRMQAGDFDVIDTLFHSEKRERIYDFSKPYARIDVPVFFRSDLSGIHDENDLKGFAVGVKSGDNTIEVLKAKGMTNLVEFRSYEAIVKAASDGKVNVFTVDKPPALYFLFKMGINDRFKMTRPLYTGEFHRAVLKGHKAILEKVETGFAQISKTEYDEIEKNWYGTPILSPKLKWYILTGSAAVVLILALLFLWLGVLKRIVAQRTAALQQEVQIRIKQEKQLQDSNDRFMSIFNATSEAIFIHELLSFTIIDVNQTMCEMYGYSRQEALNLSVEDLSSGVAPYTFSEAIVLFRKAADGEPQQFEWQAKNKNAQLFWVEVRMRVASIGSKDRVIVTVRNITERKHSEKSLLRLNRLYVILSRINESIIRIREPEDLFRQACQIAVEEGGLRMAWVGLVDQETLQVTPVARWGADDGYLDSLVISAADIPEGQGPTGTAIREGIYCVCADWQQDMRIRPWREKGVAHGYHSSIAFPIHLNQRIIGALTLYAEEPNFFSDEEIHLIKPLPEDISYALSFMDQEKQRRQAELALEEETIRRRIMFEQSPDGILIIDPQTKQFIDFNTAAHRQLGYSREEFSQLSIFDLEARETGEEINARVAGVIQDGKADFETLQRTRTGEIRNVHVTAQIVNFQDHPIYYCTWRDITVRKQNELELQRFKAIIDYSDDAIISKSLDGIIQSWNRGAERIFGYTARESVGKPMLMLFPQDRLDEETEILSRISQGEKVDHFETIRVRKDGRLVDISATISPIFDAQGNVTAVSKIARDITRHRQDEEALKASQKQLSDIINFLPDATLVVDKERRVIVWNKAIEEMTGIPAAEMIGRGGYGYAVPFYGEARPLLLDYLFMDLGDPAARYPYIIHDAEFIKAEVFCKALYDNRGAWIFGKASLLRNPSGSIVGAIESLRDITDRKRAEANLLHINESLEHRVKQEVQKNMEQERMLIHQSRMAAMSEMLGNVAHQWRQPLSSLGILLYNIKDAYQFNELDEAYLNQAFTDGNRIIQNMSTTITSFHSFFSADDKSCPFSVQDQIEKTIAIVESDFLGSHVSIHLNIPKDLMLSGFPNKFSQALLNLLSNAKEAIVKNQPPLSGSIDIIVTEQDGMGCVTVSDTGGGIPADIMGRIFDPYFSTKERGSGVGLYMAKMIIERHMNGSITANNIDGGAEFRICIPLAGEV